MRKKSVRKMPEPPPVPPAASIDPREMMFALGIFQAGIMQRMPTKNPESLGIDLGTASAAKAAFDALPAEVREQFVVKQSRLAPKDLAVHRGFEAAMTHYKDHPQQVSIVTRLMAFYFLLNSIGKERLKKWSRASSENSEVLMIHPAVMEAVATVKTDRYGSFDIDEFFAAVEKIAAEKYSES